MKRRWWLGHAVCCALLLAAVPLCAAPAQAPDAPQSERGKTPSQPVTASTSWYFTVSGDSRDCGNLIMPKIARSIAAQSAQTPAAFYWHLGDLRNIIQPDCDMIIPLTGNCNSLPPAWGPLPLGYYLNVAWDDFIKNQIEPFGQLPFFIGIGNHELYALHTRDGFRRKFQRWLTQPAIYMQLAADQQLKPPITPPDLGMTYYHFVKNGVDFIYLDNAIAENNPTQFDAAQMNWFNQVLAADLANPKITTIVVGMHAALPNSKSSGHAMDSSCQGVCSGQRVYDLLYQASISSNKKIYVLASHAHNFQEDVYNTPRHRGQVLPGWIIGTAGAFQYLTGEASAPGDTSPLKDCWKTKNCYGYLLVEVLPDGSINPRFQQVTADSAPAGNAALNDYCFNKNGRITPNTPPSFNCACGAAN